MAEETVPLKRDSTMAVTAEEGEQFLEQQGNVDKDAKTRGQQKQLDEIQAEAEPDETLKRATTMDATAKEGSELLQGADLGKTRAETEQKKEEKEDDVAENDKQEENSHQNGKSEGSEEQVEEDAPEASLKRKSTMAVTAEEGEEFLKRQKLKDTDTEADANKEIEA